MMKFNGMGIFTIISELHEFQQELPSVAFMLQYKIY